MRHIVLTVVVFCTAVVCFAQHGTTYSSPGGFGNILYPGTGHAPNAPATTTPRRIGGGYGGYGVGPRVNHPAHGRMSIVPYPVIVGGYGYGGYGGYGNGYDAPPPPQGYQDSGPAIINNPAPSVVINQTFIPDRAAPREYQGPPEPEQSGMHVYEGLQTAPQETARRRAVDQPTLYLIAFTDKRIVPALGYWIESGNLHYVSTEHTLNQASLDLIDRDLSQQLNDERNVEFRLPRQ